MHPLDSRHARRALVPGLLVLALGPAQAGPAAAINYYWSSAVDGAADNPARWTPAGVPTGADNVNMAPAGTYTITFPAAVASTLSHSLLGGNVTLVFSAPHTTSGFNVDPGPAGSGSTARVTSGVLNADFLELDGGNFPADLTLTGKNTELHSKAHVHATGSGDIVGLLGTSTLRVSAGASFYSGDVSGTTYGLKVGTRSNSQATLAVAGYDLLTLKRSHLYLVGLADLLVGSAGTGTLSVTNGGLADLAHDAYVTRQSGSVGLVTVGATSNVGLNSAAFNVAGRLGIGRQSTDIATGRAELTILNAGTVRVAGPCEIGSPAGDDGCFLRVLEGGTFIGSGGLQLWPTWGLGLDLRGGITHVHGGALTWPAARELVVSSHVGTPNLWIANGVANTGPFTSGATTGLTVGRGGVGALRVSRTGTVLNLGNGTTSVGDSTGGDGTFRVDSSAAVVSNGDVIVGNRGNGLLEVLAGSSVTAKRLTVGAVANSDGRVTVRGASATLGLMDYAWVGGSPLTGGGVGFVEVDSGATLLLSPSSVAPTRTTIHPNGVIRVSHGSHFYTSGDVICFGRLTLRGGEASGTLLSIGVDGYVDGYGDLSSSATNSGTLDPSSTDAPFGTLHVAGYFTQGADGRMRVRLGHSLWRRNDSLVVDGPVALAGALDITLDASFDPVPGDTFTLVTCSARTGTFDAVTWNGAPLADQATVLYEPGGVRLAMPGATTAVEPGAPVAALRLAALPSAGAPAFALELPSAAEVRARLYDVGGREVATLADSPLAAGRHRLEAAAARLPSGIYFARAVVRAGGATEVRSARAVVLR